jgi:hypothetical protein
MDIEDVYYKKYLKYKLKYLELKQSGGGFFYNTREENLYGKELLKKIKEKIQVHKKFYKLRKEHNIITIYDIEYMKNNILYLLKQIKEKIPNINEFDEIKNSICTIYPNNYVKNTKDENKIEQYNNKENIIKLKSDIEEKFEKLKDISNFSLLKEIFNDYYKFFEISLNNKTGPDKVMKEEKELPFELGKGQGLWF